MDWWIVLIIFIVIVLIVWWLLSRQTEDEVVETHKEAEVPAKKDDLTKIEGIGPKVQELLNAEGITTYSQLAARTPEELDAILDAAGSIYQAMDESTWPKQAALAAEGKWDELQQLQDELSGGRR